MRIIYLGSSEFGIECLNAVLKSNHTLQFIVTQPPHPAGRGRKQYPTPVACWAKDHSIPFVETDNVNTPAMTAKIADFGADLILVAAFGQKIGNELIDLPPKGAINVHASLLPRYRGAAPINWAIINGETQTGISIISLAQKMDAGDILAQTVTDIGPDETAGRLHDRLASMAAPLLIKTLDQIADGTAVYTEQEHSKATLAPKLRKSHGYLDFARPAEGLRKRILGLWPWPGASALYISRKIPRPLRVTIAMAHVAETSNPGRLPPGTLDEDLNVICALNALRITRIRPAGGSLMDFKSFTNGRHTCPGDLFAKIENEE